MRHGPSRPLNVWRSLPRAVACSVAALAELSPLRAVMALAVALGFGASTAVAVTSVGGPTMQAAEQTVLTERPAPTVSRDAERPDVPGGESVDQSASAPGSALPERSQAPKAPALKTSRPSDSPNAPRTSPQQDPTGRGAGSSASSDPSDPDADASRTPPADGSAPETVLAEWYPDSNDAVFSFRASEAASYECSVDGAPYTPCDSPENLSDLHPGWHTFAVRSRDAAGNVDPSPAVVRWHANAGSAGAQDGR